MKVNMQIVLFLMTITIAFAAVINVADEKSSDTCKKVGEKCFSNDDCCSKTCPYYWGKCVSGSLTAVNDAKDTEVKCSKTYEQCQISSDCCKGNICSSYMAKCIPMMGLNPPTPNSNDDLISGTVEKEVIRVIPVNKN
ncbi:uncharacterized protein LOC134835589 [Culicoides brevitarsis]|uniref:uncharacterized protein LOC134835589 n=1 Tax=Culicoides brevitarsis TaxID=469753 RepID=UPI00307C54FC